MQNPWCLIKWVMNSWIFGAKWQIMDNVTNVHILSSIEDLEKTISTKLGIWYTTIHESDEHLCKQI